MEEGFEESTPSATCHNVALPESIKKEYRCHRNTRPEKVETNSRRRVPSKNTNCSASLKVSIRAINKNSRLHSFLYNGSQPCAMEEGFEESTPSATCHNVALPESIKKMLPLAEPDYHVCHLNYITELSGNDECQFTATLRHPLCSEEEFNTWLSDFQKATYTTWRVKKTFSRSGRFILFKKEYRCHRNTRPEKVETNSRRRVPSKNTNCSASLKVSIRAINKNSRSKDIHLPQYPTEIVLEYTHNHPVNCADALKFRDVSDKTARALEALFKQQFGPMAAVEILRKELQAKSGDNYPIVAADRSICPDVQYAYRLYRKVFKKEYKEPSEEEMKARLQDYTNQYNAEISTSSCTDDSTEESLRQVVEDLIKKMQEEPSLMVPAIKAFVDNYNRIKTSPHLLCSAMYAFGKYRGAGGSLKSAHGVRKKAIKRLRGSKSINVQPTSKAR